MSRAPDLIREGNRGFPSGKKLEGTIRFVDLSDKEVIHEVPLALLLGFAFGNGDCADSSTKSRPRSVEQALTVDKRNKVRLLIFLAINLRHYPHKLIDGNGVIVPGPLQIPEILAFEAVHFHAFNDDSYLLRQPTWDSPELPTIRVFVQTSIEHQNWCNIVHRGSSSQFLVSPASVAPRTDLCGVLQTSVEDLGEGRNCIADSGILVLRIGQLSSCLSGRELTRLG